MENIILGAAILGLGSCWIGAFDEGKVKDVLEVPENIKVIAMSPIGYPAGKIGIQERIRRFMVKTKKRKSLSEIVHYEKRRILGAFCKKQLGGRSFLSYRSFHYKY